MNTNVTLVVPVLWFVKDQICRNSYRALLLLPCLFSLLLCIENIDCKNCVIILFRKLEGISLEANCHLSRCCHYTINVVLCAGQREHNVIQNVFHAVLRLLHVMSFDTLSALEGGSMIIHCPCK
jgi:hypothetical protein